MRAKLFLLGFSALINTANADQNCIVFLTALSQAAQNMPDSLKTVATLDRLAALERNLVESERSQTLHDASIVGSKKLLSEATHKKFVENANYFQTQQQGPLSLINNFEFKKAWEWLRRTREHRTQFTTMAQAAGPILDRLNSDHYFLQRADELFQLNPDQPLIYRINPRENTGSWEVNPDLARAERLPKNTINPSNLKSEKQRTSAEAANVILALTPPKKSEGAASYLKRAYSALPYKLAYLSEVEFYRGAIVADPKLFEHAFHEVSLKQPAAANNIKAMLLAKSQGDLLKYLDEIQTQIRTGVTDPAKGSQLEREITELKARVKKDFQKVREEMSQPRVGPVVATVLSVVISSIFANLAFDEDDEVKDLQKNLEEMERALKDQHEYLVKQREYQAGQDTDLQRQIEGIKQSTKTQGNEYEARLNEVKERHEQLLKEEKAKTNELHSLLEDVKSELQSLRQMSDEKREVLRMIQSHKSPNMNRSAQLLLEHFDSRLAPEQQRTTEEWKKKLQSMASKPSENQSRKEAFEFQIEKSAPGGKIIYNSAHPNPLDFIVSGKGQCFAMTNAFIMTEMLNRGNEYTSENPVVIQLDGHVLSGRVENFADKDGKQRKRLIGVEHTAAGKAEIDFGPTDSLQDHGKGIRVLEPSDYALIIAGRDVATPKELDSHLKFATALSAKKFGINLPALEALIQKTPSGDGGKKGAVNSSISSFGEASVKEGDFARKPLTKTTFGDPIHSQSINGGATLQAIEVKSSENTIEDLPGAGLLRSDNFHNFHSRNYESFREPIEAILLSATQLDPKGEERVDWDLSDDVRDDKTLFRSFNGLYALSSKSQIHQRIWKRIAELKIKDVVGAKKVQDDYALGLVLRMALGSDLKNEETMIAKVTQGITRTTNVETALELRFALDLAAKRLVSHFSEKDEVLSAKLRLVQEILAKGSKDHYLGPVPIELK